MINKIARLFHFCGRHKGLAIMLSIFTITHWWLWTNYYISIWGWIRHIPFLSSTRVGFSLMGIFYWGLYCAVLCLAYARGKKIFIVTSLFYVFCLAVAIPFSLAKVDLSVKFALLLKSNFQWMYVKNYLHWVVWTFSIFVLLIGFLCYILNKTYRGNFVIRKSLQNITLGVLITVIGYHLVIRSQVIDTEFRPVPYYDNEMGRVLRVLEALFFYNFNLFPSEELEGHFQRYEIQPPNMDIGIHGVYAFLDTLQYEYLSIHGNSLVPKNQDLVRYMNQGILVDLGPTLSCGSHTTASIPDMFSLNGCRVGPFFHSEVLAHLMKRIGVENYFVGEQGLSQYFRVVFEDYVAPENRHHVTYEDTSRILQITGERLASYPKTPSSLTTVYYDAVHPGFKCSFIIAGGLGESECGGYKYFGSGTSEYLLGMPKAIQVIEGDLVRFIELTEKNPRPIFMILTSDHGLSKKFSHGDMADSEISPNQIHEAVQRHTNFLVYGNQSYRNLRSTQWKILQNNAKRWAGHMDHQALVPSILGGLGISWDQEQKISPYNVFSLQFRPIIKNKVISNDYLNSMPKSKDMEAL